MCNVFSLAIFFPLASPPAVCLLTLEPICVNIGPETYTTGMADESSSTYLPTPSSPHIYFVCLDFGTRIRRARVHNARRQTVCGMNEDVILEFCRFSYAINAPLCVLVKLSQRWCLRTCVRDVLLFTGHLTSKLKTFAYRLRFWRIKSAHTFLFLLVVKSCVARVCT